MIYLPPFYEPDITPVYKIDNKFYEVTTLKLSKYKSWPDQALFGIPFNPFRDWIHQPILVRTRYGGFILEITDQNDINVSSMPVKRAISSPILQLYLINIPESYLPAPNKSMFKLLQSFIRLELSLEEYICRIPIQENLLKIPYKELVKLNNEGYVENIYHIPHFENPDMYAYTNVLVVAELKGYGYRATIASKNPIYYDPYRIPIGKI